ncbi:MAG: sugar phosphate nucleotidyltransferase [Candidatus Krumholzibacteria bacterium]|jgi:glucose-1-phosphate thymidylyltransferase|nr:sugar phosphate nucleotidyltransferase [Candidatus Krumholzibacteria bacterium]MDP6669759.1 sugar phosphate nucleotidyltransferase [Candidatus Krumholzibacteria bacterium]MDP6797304.1 sugar phosphate nucleotidyltransferase [Candidatus Krumholzibacteria bacterium]MDP7021209.1 sugar phosphate nucleotidyltransferase [Candidatus Krumholzibacteria bacterium]
MKAIIPAAGVGTRLRPHTYSTPKALLPVAGRPVLAHILDSLVGLGLEKVVLVVGYLGDEILDWVRKNYELEVEFVLQEKREGLGHAFLMAMEKASLREGPAVGVLGDTIFKADLAQFLSLGSHAMGVKRVEDPRRFGVAELEGGRISNLVEKPEHPKSDLALVGLYSFSDLAPLYRALSDIVARDQRTRGEYQLTDGLQAMIDAGEELLPFEIENWYDVGKPETWLKTNRVLLESAAKLEARDGVEIIPPVYLHPDAIVEESRIGPHVSVGAGSRVISSRIENSVIDEGCRVTDSTLSASLLGANCEVSRAEGQVILGNESVFMGGKE